MPLARHESGYRRAAAFRWRLLTLASGTLLAACFFMPAVTGCNAAIVPWRETADALRASREDLAELTLEYVWQLLLVLAMYVPAYLAGAVIAAGSLARLLRKRRAALICAAGLVLVIALEGGCLPTITALSIVARGPPGLQELLDPETLLFLATFVLIPVLALSYLVFTARLRPLAYLCHMFGVSIVATVWFGYWLAAAAPSGDALYGLYLSFLAACLLLLGAVGEARAMTGRGWWRTFGQLLACRLRERPTLHAQCPACGYDLFGLSEMRCPECGRPFTFDGLGVSAAELGYQGHTANAANGTTLPPTTARTGLGA